MNPEQLSETIVDALTALVADGAVTLPDGVPTEVTVERPRQKGHGDYATNVALQLAKKAGTNPRAFAELVAERLRASDGIAGVEVAGPGFLNITVEAGAQGQVAADVVAAGAAYGASDAFAGEKINLEFVSANPTGPCTSAGCAGRRVGDALGRVFSLAGAEVTREYYFNDHGAQIDRFSSSLAGVRAGPAGARGRLRRRVHRGDRQGRHGRAARRARPARRRGAGGLPRGGVEMMFAEIKQSLHDFGVDFDVYFHEDDLHETGAVERAIDRLDRAGQHLRGRRALWLRTEKFGDDKDRVIVRSNGAAAYMSGDLGLLPRQARAGLRPLLHHARRRPPRLCRPDERDVRGLRRRARARTWRS